MNLTIFGVPIPPLFFAFIAIFAATLFDPKNNEAHLGSTTTKEPPYSVKDFSRPPLPTHAKIILPAPNTIQTPPPITPPNLNPPQQSISFPPTELPKLSEEDKSWNIINSGIVGLKRVALTFDDGPHKVYTPKVLDVLREHKAKATFFVLGSQVRMYPWILSQIMAEGHEIGNHTYSHLALTAKTVTEEVTAREIISTQDLIKNTIGYETPLFRPPYGAFRRDDFSRTLFKEQGLKIVLWSVDTRDWRVRDPERILKTIVDQTRDGSIILLHDIHKTTLEALPSIMDALESEGYQFVTVSELCNLPSLKLVHNASESAVPQK